jgi:hypothetical protein
MRNVAPVIDSQSPGWGGTPRGAGAGAMSSDVDTPASVDDRVEEADGDEEAPCGSLDNNEDVCRICRDGGSLLCCDGCPASFHPACLNLAQMPTEEFFCMECVAAQEAAADMAADFHDEPDYGGTYGGGGMYPSGGGGGGSFQPSGGAPLATHPPTGTGAAAALITQPQAVPSAPSATPAPAPAAAPAAAPAPVVHVIDDSDDDDDDAPCWDALGI